MTVSQIVPARDWPAAVTAFPGKTVDPVANDVDFRSRGFLRRARRVQQGLLAFVAFVHRRLDERRSLPHFNRILSLPLLQIYFSPKVFSCHPLL